MSKNNGIVPTNSSRMALDNLLRRELKVSDPNDPQQVAKALFDRYKNTPKAAAIVREAEGVPFLLSSAVAPPMMQGTTSSDAEMQQAVNDVNRDLQELTTNTILKDIDIELQGWATAIRSAIQEGINAARFALDARQRDKTFGIRRTLGDYARIARLVGALTPSLTINYRKLAQSLDEVSAVLLVMMGETLANVGFNGGRFLLQAPYSELQIRRDSVIYALRNLVGSTQEAYAPNEWPRGVDAYRQLFKFLEVQGQGDLRALLVENELSRVIDALLQMAGQGGVEGLRQLGATAQLDIERMRRLVIIGQRAVSPNSPPLAGFLEALQLFIDAFESSGGFRLLRIARPPILFYGLYGNSVSQASDSRLLDLIIRRGVLAGQLDCFSQCGCDPKTVKCQLMLDKILYDVDRAIDLYAVGKDDFGEPEQRASAYSYLIEAFLVPANLANCPGMNNSIETSLTDIQSKLRLDLTAVNFKQNVIDLNIQDRLHQELCIQRDMEDRWKDLVKTLAPDCVPYDDVFNATKTMIQSAITLIAGKDDSICDFAITLPNHYEVSLDKQAIDVSSISTSQASIVNDFKEIIRQISNDSESSGSPIPPSP